MTKLELWTQEQILAQAADEKVAKSAQSLARPVKWTVLAQPVGGGALWGEHQGSGSKPYKVAVDLDGPAFKCSCPSRKKPCKHAIALFLTAQANPRAVSTDEKPDWVDAWLNKRRTANASKKPKATKPSVVDKAAQAKRAAQRKALVQQGIDSLRLWLDDLVRQGLSQLPTQPKSYWETQAARLVDSKAPGLARHIREMSSIPYSGEGWPARMLDRLGRLHLLLQAYARIDTLPPALQEDVRTQMGWWQDQSELKEQPGQRDQWAVLSMHESMDSSLITRQTWLWGLHTRQAALILDFIALGQTARAGALPAGITLDAELVYFTSATPQRALIKQRFDTSPISVLSGYPTLDAAFQYTSQSLAQNPWLERFLWPLENVIPVQDDETWYIKDTEGYSLPLRIEDIDGWRLMSLSGGHPMTLVAEWDREQLTPLSVWTGTEFITLRDQD